ncbi:hypothetical protein HYY71_00905 [Candidatus Woesearchaeota archaeon]|nr:hypothetical protein [Candidatus Woesearchaeota archaeon]
METYTINVSLNFSSTWRGPGAHSVIFCANDSAGNSRCIGSYDFLVTGGNITQFEETLQSFGSAGSVGINITFGNGTEIPSAADSTGGAGTPAAASFFDPLARNYTFIFNTSATTKIYIVGLRVDENQLGNLSNANLTTTAQKGVTQAIGSGFATTMAGGEFAKFIPSFVLYKFGVIELAGVGFDKHMYCSGSDLFSSPNCTAINRCNATAFGANNDSAVLNTIFTNSTVGGASACWLEGDKAQLNGVALTTGKTYTFVSHFSQGTVGNDTGAPEIQLHGSLINNDGGRTRHQTPPSDVSIFNTTGTSIVINFTVADLNSTGINMSINNTINVTVVPAGDTGLSAGVFFISGIGRNLTCFPVGFATNSSVFNITGENAMGNLTDGVNCTVTVSALTNGTKNITVTAVDASNNSNRNVTSVLIIVDQIPPVLLTLNFSNSSVYDTTASLGRQDPATVPAAGDGTWAQGRKLFALANYTDNLTQPFNAVLQFYNASTPGWQTVNASTNQFGNQFNLTNVGTRTNATANFSFVPSTGHNDAFEGKNVSFRILVNDTLGNINNSAIVRNITIQINDTTPALVTINGTISVNGLNTTDTRPIISWFLNEPNQLTSINVSVDGTVGAGVGVESSCQKSAFFDRTVGTNFIEKFRNSSFQIADDPACTLGNGTHNITVRVVDTWNNVNQTSHLFTVQSGSVPGLVLNNITDLLNNRNISEKHNPVNNTPITSLMGLTFSGTGGAVSIENLTYVSSCNTSATVLTKNATAIYPFNESTCPTTSGNRTLTITITDKAGNSNTTVFGFTVDNEAPSLVFHTPTEGSIFDNLTSVNVSAFDSESHVDSIFYYLDGINTVLNHSINETTNLTRGTGQNTSIISRLVNFTPGTHTIKISVNDTLGNVRNSSVITFKSTGLLDPGNLSESSSNYSAGPYGPAIMNVTIRAKADSGVFTAKSGSGQRNISSETIYEILFTIQNSNKTNVSITDFNGSSANWDKINFTPLVNRSTAIAHLRNNWTNSVLMSVSFNNSLEEFLPSNDSYFGVVEWPVNISKTTNTGTAQELWWVSYN